MTYSAAEARQELLDAIAQATEAIGTALGALGAAYEQLDENTADRVEDELFGPVQSAYGRAKRTYAGFAERHGLEALPFAHPGAPHGRAPELLERAVSSVSEADDRLALLQDSMMPVEVGDAELRAGLTEVRELLDPVRSRSRELTRTLGR
jgi:hypothetical protein